MTEYHYLGLKLDELVRKLKEKIKEREEEVENLPPTQGTHTILYTEINTLYDVIFDIDQVFKTNYYLMPGRKETKMSIDDKFKKSIEESNKEQKRKREKVNKGFYKGQEGLKK